MPDGRDGRVVLIVQEEFVIRMDVADAFDKAGFKVLQAEKRRRSDYHPKS
jgi:hypothetical protein